MAASQKHHRNRKFKGFRGFRDYADGGMVGPWNDYAATPEQGPWTDYQAPAADPNAEPADHGLSERQKLSPIGKALSPITSYPETYSRMNREAREQMSQGAEHVMHPEGAWDFAKGAGNTALGALNYVASPFSAAYRSIAGQPIEDVTGIPREYTEFAAQLATPGIGFTKLGAPAPGSVVPKAPTAPVRPMPSNNVVSAAERVSDVAPNPINVPRAFASDSIATQRAGQLARNVPFVGNSIPRATGEMVEQLGDATKSIASHYGEGSGPNVANRIGRTLQEGAEAETAAATNAARRSDEALEGAFNRDLDAAQRTIADREAQSLAQAREAVGDLSPQDMGQTLIARLRAGEQEARATKDRLYQIAGDSDAAINSDAVRNVRARVAQTLDDEGRVIDGVLTPASSRMLDELQRLSTLNIENRAVGARPPVPGGEEPVRAAVSMQGIEQTRKRLNALSQAASNDADRAAARRIIREYDNWLSDSFDNALFSGSDDALQAFRQARQANTEWRQRFGFNARDDADRIINRIVTGEVTPQEVSNWLVGASQVGSKGVSSRLLTRLAEATGNDPEALQAIRGGIWNRLSQATEGATPKASEKVASGINEFLNGSGRDVARRLFTPEQQNIMRTYADVLRRGAAAREGLAEAAKNARPSQMEVGIGPMQELATAVLGKRGKSDEALFSAIDAYARSGARGDVKTLSEILKAIPQQDRGDLAGAIIRKLGQSTTTGTFSPELFASEWLKYSPQAKTLLFGNAGAHRQALDDIAMISQRYKDIGRRFGNASNTAQHVTGFGAITWLLHNPYIAVPSLLGGTVFARMLSAPATARKVATWGKTASALAKGVTPEKMRAYETASKALTAAARSLGSDAHSADFMRAIQGLVPANADKEQQ